MCTYASFFPPCFSCHCVGFLFLYCCCFLLFSLSFTKMKAYTVCATAQASIFTVFWPFTGSQRNCQIVEDVWTMIEQVVESKDVRRQTRKLQGVGGHFFINWVRNVIEKAGLDEALFLSYRPQTKCSISQFFKKNCTHSIFRTIEARVGF